MDAAIGVQELGLTFMKVIAQLSLFESIVWKSGCVGLATLVAYSAL